MNVARVDIQAHGRKTNGFAVASLITGLLPTVVLGLIFGILGIFRSRRVGRGMTMSVSGILLALLWIAPIVIVMPHVMKSMDPGCREAKQIQDQYPQSRLATDFNDPALYRADNDAVIQGLTDSAVKTKSSEASKYMIAEANDIRLIEQTTAQKQVLTAGMVEQGDNDETALHKACGAF